MTSQWRLDALTTTELLDLARASVNTLAGRDYDHLDNLTRLDILDGFEHLTRALPGIGHEVINQLGQQNAAEELTCPNLPSLLSERLHITTADAKRRIAAATALGPGVGIGGQPIPGAHAPTGQAQRDGDINAEHAEVILRFFKRLPAEISARQREEAEQQLVDLAKQTHPDAVAAAAQQIEAHLNPDGDAPSEDERKGKTYFRMGPQGKDKLTRGTFCVDPECRAYMEAYFGKAGEPGVGNPDDEHPIVDTDTTAGAGADQAEADRAGADRAGASGGRGRPADPTPGQQDLFDYFAPEAPDTADTPEGPAQSPDDAGARNDTDGTSTPPEAHAPQDDAGQSAAARRDRRSTGQRHHDAIKRLFRTALGAPRLGQHNGLRVTAIITMTLQQLETAAGNAITGGGAMIPMREAIRMASHAHHYLLIYNDHGRPLHLGRTKRLASPDQRIVLYARDRGCTFPNCPRPGYHCQVHHTNEWADNGRTDIDLLTFACPEHHRLVGPGEHDWATTIAPATSRYPFRTIWHPPACIDPQRRGRINHYLFPGEYLQPPETFGGPPRHNPKARRGPEDEKPPPGPPRDPPQRE